MQLYKPFQFLTADECDELIQYAKTNNIRAGKTARDKKNKLETIE